MRPFAALRILRELAGHPLNRHGRLRAMARFVRWQLAARLVPYPFVVSLTSRSRLVVTRGMTGATGNVYSGLHDFADMGFLLHFLRPKDFFVDVGANVGSYTILAAAEVGARTAAFEPVPATFEHLMDNVRLNGVERLVSAQRLGLGAESSTVEFTAGLGTVNHVAAEGESDVIRVEIDTLTRVLGSTVPQLIKIDVEGYELAVLRGGASILKAPDLKAIIVELNGSGRRYGVDDEEVDAVLRAGGFAPHAYEPFSRSLTPTDANERGNTLYLRDLDFVSQRVSAARRFHVLDMAI